MPVLASMCCAKSSASTTCSVKNFEPMVILDCAVFLQPETKQAALAKHRQHRITPTMWRCFATPSSPACPRRQASRTTCFSTAPGGGKRGEIRSGEGRVGEKGRSWGWPVHLKKKKKRSQTERRSMETSVPRGSAREDSVARGGGQALAQGASWCRVLPLALPGVTRQGRRARATS